MEKHSEIWLKKFKDFYNFAKSLMTMELLLEYLQFGLVTIQLTINQKKLKMTYHY